MPQIDSEPVQASQMGGTVVQTRFGVIIADLSWHESIEYSFQMKLSGSLTHLQICATTLDTLH